MIDKSTLDKAVLCVVGLGYVGLPLAEAFSGSLKVIGFDIDSARVDMLKNNNTSGVVFTDNPEDVAQADFIFICVPTPVNKDKTPDLSYIENAAEIISRNMKKGSVVILESTVYPGVTEEVVKPILENSGLVCGQDFKIAYCPERMNPGDREHSMDKVTKVVSGMDDETTELVAELYRKVTPYIHKTGNIMTAEAAKVIENIQRDLNIALMNELSIIFGKMGLNARDVFEAAGTKWNFHHYFPGLVGGHCIPVDPYYLVYKSKELGYNPQVILAGRAINDYMPEYIADMTAEALKEAGKTVKNSRILIMGMTYKEDVADTRESPVKVIIKRLKEEGASVLGFDPLLDAGKLEKEFGVKSIAGIDELSDNKVDGVILAVIHSSFKEIKLAGLKEIQNGKPVLIDVRGAFNAAESEEAGFYYKSLQ